jgi:hypothetical protein
MGYDNMDHAGWVVDKIATVQRRTPTGKVAKNAANRKGWHGAPKQLSAFQARAFTILGIVGGGIYNAPIFWDSMIWRPDSLVFLWAHDLATHDFQGLTDLVFLAHDASIRVLINSNMRKLQIVMHDCQRATSASRVQGHPTLEEAVASHRARFPLDHPVHREWFLEQTPKAEP